MCKSHINTENNYLSELLIMKKEKTSYKHNTHIDNMM